MTDKKSFMFLFLTFALFCIPIVSAMSPLATVKGVVQIDYGTKVYESTSYYEFQFKIEQSSVNWLSVGEEITCVVETAKFDKPNTGEQLTLTGRLIDLLPPNPPPNPIPLGYFVVDDIGVSDNMLFLWIGIVLAMILAAIYILK